MHELVHAIDDCQSGHRGNFRLIAKAIGLEGRMTQTQAGPSLRSKLAFVGQNLGEFPQYAFAATTLHDVTSVAPVVDHDSGADAL